MSTAYTDIDVSKELRQCGVTKLGRENTKIIIEYHFQAHDGQDISRIFSFGLKSEGFFSTIEEFDKQARGGWGPTRRIGIPPETIEKTKIVFANNPYYRQAFEYYERDTKPDEHQKPPSIGESSNHVDTEAANEEEQRRREEAYASAISDPDYDDVKRNERLVPITVTNAIRKDPGRYCVYGIIDTVRNPFKLMTEVGFVCSNRKCTAYGNPKWQILDTPIFSVDDMPIAFKAERDGDGKIRKIGQQLYLEFLTCPYCRGNRQVRPRTTVGK